MQVPAAFTEEYQDFLEATGLTGPDPQALLMELASISLDVYIKEVVWLSDFIGRIQLSKNAAA